MYAAQHKHFQAENILCMHLHGNWVSIGDILLLMQFCSCGIIPSRVREILAYVSYNAIVVLCGSLFNHC